ncbi:MAG TPA: AAA family ATPase [Patescibacteria group bacterium]|nr:AAA family ATPase [Patescibacteria group bacterium]
MNILDVHKKNFDFFKNAVKNGKLHHTYVFYGPAGSGKFLFAIELARYIQCDGKESEYPCGECKSCKMSKNGYISGGFILNKGKDEEILKEDIVEAKKNVELSSYYGKKKIIIINNAQNIGYQSKDLLLKTLEEPPSNSLIILITDNKELLPKTVLSRCPAVFFARPSLKKIKGFIDTKFNTSGLADLYYFFNLGNINTFLDRNIIEKELIEENSRAFAEELNILLVNSDLFKKMILAKKIDDRGEVKETIQTWVLILYHLLLSKQGNEQMQDINKKVFESLEKNLEYDKIVKTLTSLFLLLAKLETNASKRLLIEDFILQM